MRRLYPLLLGVFVTGCGSVTSEVFQTVGQPLQTPTPPARDDVVLVDFGFSTSQGEFDGRNLSWAVILENPNEEWLATNMTVSVSFLDAAGSIVATGNDNLALIWPGKQAAVTGSDLNLSNPDLATIATMDVQLASPDWEEPDGPVGELTVSDIATRIDEFGEPFTTARVESTFADEITNPIAVVVYYDAAGAVIGGDFTFVEFVPAGDSIPIGIYGSNPPGLTSSDVFITFSYLSL